MSQTIIQTKEMNKISTKLIDSQHWHNHQKHKSLENYNSQKFIEMTFQNFSLKKREAVIKILY